MHIGLHSPNLLKSEDMSKINEEAKRDIPSAAKPADIEPPKKKAPARKKSKKPKDMPKRPLSAYNIFFQIERKKLMEAREKGETPEDFDMASVSSTSDGDEQDKRKKASLFQAIAQTIANRWKALPSDERVKFEEMAKEEMKKYRIKKDEYQQRMVRETLDGSSGRASSSAGSQGMPHGQLSTAGIGGSFSGGQPLSATTLGYPGMLGGHVGLPGSLPVAGAPAVTILTMPQSYGIEDLLQRRGISTPGDQFGGVGLAGQDHRVTAIQLQGLGGGTNLDRLLALRALQNDPSISRLDSFPQSGIPGYLSLSGAAGLDPRLSESLRLPEGTGGFGGLGGSSGLSNLEFFGRAGQANLQLSDLPPDQLLRYLNARQGGGDGGSGGGQPPRGYPGY